MKKEIYIDVVLEQIPRLLGLLDRNPASRTYGCFDRQYWHYHVADFASARCQEACLTLALLYKTDYKKNIYFQNKLILSWIKGALEFWKNIQNANGSFNEWYPYESSFVATAFSSYAVSETLLLLPELKNDSLMKALVNAADFLSRKTEKSVQNQLSGAILALYNIFLLTKNEKYKEASLKKLQELKSMQSGEGWFMEYGGADIGYLSLTVDYLAKLYMKSKNPDALAIAGKAVSFLHNFIHPDTTFGGDYGSRNTEYLIPAGFEILKLDEASSISYHIRKSLARKSTVAPFSLDDRYLSYITCTYIQAYLHAKNKVAPLKNSSKTIYFSEAGMLVHNNKYFLISNLNKGNSFRAFIKNKVIYDSGIQLITERSRLFSGYIRQSSRSYKDNCAKVEGYLEFITDTKMSPFKMAAFRIFQLTLGRFEFMSFFVKNILRNILVMGKRSNIKYSRELIIEPNLRIIDTLYSIPKGKIIISAKSSYNAVPSSKYFQKSELKNVPFSITVKKPCSIRITRVFDSKGNLQIATKII
ncbi:MAG: hypothetical protein AABW87_00105 [Nanoarchaeota archaeon]